MTGLAVWALNSTENLAKALGKVPALRLKVP